MALLPILRFPDTRLHTVAAPVIVFDDSVRTLVSNLADTMYEAPGVGLAATQVNVHLQVIVIDVSANQDQPLCLINPEIIERHGEFVAILGREH